jgi:hypothetical protein
MERSVPLLISCKAFCSSPTISTALAFYTYPKDNLSNSSYADTSPTSHAKTLFFYWIPCNLFEDGPLHIVIHGLVSLYRPWTSDNILTELDNQTRHIYSYQHLTLHRLQRKIPRTGSGLCNPKWICKPILKPSHPLSSLVC